MINSVHARVPADANAPALVTADRIVNWLAENNYSYFIDSDGDIGGLWDNRLFHFLLLGGGSAFQIRGQWNRFPGMDRLTDILDFINDWNTDRIWPKGFVRVRDDGSVVVCADLTVTTNSGLNSHQLDLQLRCGLATAAALFDALEEAFPDPLRCKAAA